MQTEKRGPGRPRKNKNTDQTQTVTKVDENKKVYPLDFDVESAESKIDAIMAITLANINPVSKVLAIKSFLQD